MKTAATPPRQYDRTIARVLMLAMPVLLVFGSAAADIGCTLIALLFLGHCWRQRDWQWLTTPWVRVAFGLWLLLLAISPWAFDSSQAFEKALPWPRLIVFAVAMQFWLLDSRWLWRLVWATTLTCSAVAADTLWQYVTGTDLLGHPWPGADRLNGPFNRPKVGIYLSKLFFPVSLGLLAWIQYHRPAGWQRILISALIPALLLAMIFLSGERMALLLVFLGIAITTLLLRGKLRRLMLATLLLLIASISAIAIIDRPLVSRQIDSTIATANALASSHYGQIWRNSLHLFSQSPWTGIGLRNFKLTCDDPEQALSLDVAPLRCATHSHNIYIEWLTETGVIGLAGFLFLVATWMRHFWRRWRQRPSLMMLGPWIAVCLILWPVATSGSFFTNWNEALFWFLLGWAMAAGQKKALADDRGADPTTNQ